MNTSAAEVALIAALLLIELNTKVRVRVGPVDEYVPMPFSPWLVSLIEYSMTSPSATPACAKVSNPVTAVLSVMAPVPGVPDTVIRARLKILAMSDDRQHAVGGVEVDHERVAAGHRQGGAVVVVADQRIGRRCGRVVID